MQQPTPPPHCRSSQVIAAYEVIGHLYIMPNETIPRYVYYSYSVHAVVSCHATMHEMQACKSYNNIIVTSLQYSKNPIVAQALNKVAQLWPSRPHDATSDINFAG